MEIVATIGSDPSNDIVINKPGVAAFHAKLTYAPGYVMVIEDLDSRFGTFVNNQRIHGPKELFAQDILCIAEHVLPFEEKYPDMLTYKDPNDITIDMEALRNQPEEENEAEAEVLEGMTGWKRWIYGLQFPKDRQQMQRIWILVISSIILLSLLLPFLSWSNPSEVSFFVNSKFDSLSGIGMFIELMDVSLSGTPLLYLVLHMLTLLLMGSTLIVSILFVLYGVGVLKLKNLLVVRRLSQIMLMLFGLNFVFQFLRFVVFWQDGENTLVKTMLFGRNLDKSRIFIENLGIGFWLCAIGFILILHSTRNGLWRPKFVRKWASLSFSFWIPFVVMLALVHQSLGVMQTTVDVENYKKRFGGNTERPEVDSRICQNAPYISGIMAVQVIREWKLDEANVEHYDSILDDHGQRRLYVRLLLWSLYGVFITLAVLMLWKSIRGNVRLVLSGVLILLGILMYISAQGLIGILPGAGGEIIQRSVGLGVYLTIIGGMGMLGEQFYFYSNRKGRGEEKLIDELE